MIVFTVHGTGDQLTHDKENEKLQKSKTKSRREPLTEPKWWERGSAFCSSLEDKLERNINIEPIVWSGKNSEVARSDGAELLFSHMRKAIKSGREFAIIGHSHGGNVAANAVQRLTASGTNMSLLKLWLTVGTPFIENYPHEEPILVGPFVQRSLFSSALIASLLAVVYLLVSFPNGELQNVAASIFMGLFMIFVALSTIQLVPRGLILRGKDYYHFLGGVKRWTGVMHNKDEAYSALQASVSAKIDLFQRGAGVAILRTAMISCFLFLFFAGTLVWLSERTGVEQINALISALPLESIGVPFMSFENYLNDRYSSDEGDYALVPLIIMWASFWIILYTVFIVIHFIVFSMSGFYKNLLNKAVKQAISQKVFGRDISAISYQLLSNTPHKSVRLVEIDAGTSSDMEDYAREKAAETLEELRSALGIMAASSKSIDLAELFIGNLSWNEMIHTSYFKVPSSQRFIVELFASRIEASEIETTSVN